MNSKIEPGSVVEMVDTNTGFSGKSQRGTQTWNRCAHLTKDGREPREGTTRRTLLRLSFCLCGWGAM